MRKRRSVFRKIQPKKQDLTPTEIKNRNKRIIEDYFKAFLKGIPSGMTKLLAEDAVFQIPGPAYSTYTRYIKGKKNINQFYIKRQKTREQFIKSLSRKTRIYPDINTVYAEWNCGGIAKLDKKQFRASGTNHFVLDANGKIKSVKIYVNIPLDPSVEALDEKRLQVSDQGKLALMAWSVV